MDFRFKYRKKPPSREELAEQQREEEIRVVQSRGLALGYAIPSALLSGPLAGWLIGSWIDKQQGTEHWMLICILLGTFAGFATMIRMIMVLGKSK